ncbi:NB-ARC domain and Death-like domain and P-loop containing nucleoside triphosphate hydrolase domain-containing protein [Strongyloides ratti]|uniref:NB-ARC domain and Death-like domain and P-loop containing nucleoside triphosphate hydrolase domain-containing protein n=1 Tax=Strongyloides ratti TaxID=34506 RepID=A0A090MWW8_STRRB|nr:NB-ARC domain and Death-like domain and P-loop containing nucleoside triphosphate hydrolase domain-containing protein [Strongyloides ratti]CEF64409.1 NB-ARC domain and Death-like domain and P-loop containing nucleoside triphosphate hydrolase domain-containing protein [Strongyloides ratti]
MLDQNSQRILANATDILYHDFEPRDCVCFFQSKGILTDDDVEEIISCNRRHGRVDLFLNKYRRRCFNFNLLKEYFTNYVSQIHLAELFDENNSHIEEKIQEPKIFLRKMNSAQIPKSISYQIKRFELEESLEKNLKQFIDGNFDWFIINGIRGCGKTLLLAQVLRNNYEYLSKYINNIYWFTDSCEITSKSKQIFIKILVSLTDTSCLQSSYPEDEDLLMGIIVEQIQSKSGKTLLIIDDVLLEENVRWYSKMISMLSNICQIISISPNEEIFQALPQEAIKFSFKNNSGFNYTQIEKLFTNDKDIPSTCLINKILDETCGLPAFLGILKFQSSNNISRLEKLVERLESCNSLTPFTSITPYFYKNMNTVFDKDFSIMDDSDILNLCHICLLFTPNIWYHFAYTTLILPLDLPSYNCDIPTLVYESIEKLSKLSLLQIDGDKFMIHPIVFKYCVGKQCQYHQIDKESLVSLFLTRLNSIVCETGNIFMYKNFKGMSKDDAKKTYNQLKDYHLKNNDYEYSKNKNTYSLFSFFRQ